MSWLEAIVFGVVQGLTEFLPISSSAHIFIVSHLFGWKDPGAAFTAVTQIGTETAVLIYFRREVLAILQSLVKWFQGKSRGSAESNFAWAIVLGSIPIGVVGFALRDVIETDFRNLQLVAVTLISFGVLLILVEKFPPTRKRTFNFPTAISMGFAQTLALIPGVSRSGATITAGLALGLNREAATRYSFLLAIPAVFASGILESFDIGSGPVAWGPTFLATFIAAGIGYAVIAGLLNFLKKHTFVAFGTYRILLGLMILVTF